MNDVIWKWFTFLLISSSLLFLPTVQAALSQIRNPSEFYGKDSAYNVAAYKSSACGDIHFQAYVFRNTKGLNDKINIIGPLRDLSAIAKTNTETIDELINQVSVWIPKFYYNKFLVNPKCIIILETKINNDGKAEIRFGVAMQCTLRSQLPDMINISI